MGRVVTAILAILLLMYGGAQHKETLITESCDNTGAVTLQGNDYRCTRNPAAR